MYHYQTDTTPQQKKTQKRRPINVAAADTTNDEVGESRSSSAAGGIRTFAVVPAYQREQPFFARVLPRSLLVESTAGTQSEISVSQVLSSSHDLRDSILTPLMSEVAARRNAGLVLIDPGTPRSRSLWLSVLTSLLSDAFSAAPHCPLALISMCRIGDDGTSVVDMQTGRTISQLHLISAAEAMRVTAPQHSLALVDSVEQHFARHPSGQGYGSVMIRIDLRGHSEILACILEPSAAALQMGTLVIRSGLSGAAKTIAPRVPFCFAFEPYVPPASTMHIACVADAADQTLSLRALRFTAELESACGSLAIAQSPRLLPSGSDNFLPSPERSPNRKAVAVTSPKATKQEPAAVGETDAPQQQPQGAARGGLSFSIEEPLPVRPATTKPLTTTLPSAPLFRTQVQGNSGAITSQIDFSAPRDVDPPVPAVPAAPLEVPQASSAAGSIAVLEVSSTRPASPFVPQLSYGGVSSAPAAAPLSTAIATHQRPASASPVQLQQESPPPTASPLAPPPPPPASPPAQPRNILPVESTSATAETSGSHPLDISSVPRRGPEQSLPNPPSSPPPPPSATPQHQPQPQQQIPTSSSRPAEYSWKSELLADAFGQQQQQQTGGRGISREAPPASAGKFVTTELRASQERHDRSDHQQHGAVSDEGRHQLMSRLVATEEAFAEASQIASALQRDNDKWQQAFYAAKSELQALRTQYEDVRGDNDRLRAENEDMSGLIKTLMRRVGKGQDMNANAHTLRGAMDDLVSKNAALERQLREAQRNLAALEQKETNRLRSNALSRIGNKSLSSLQQPPSRTGSAAGNKKRSDSSKPRGGAPPTAREAQQYLNRIKELEAHVERLEQEAIDRAATTKTDIDNISAVEASTVASEKTRVVAEQEVEVLRRQLKYYEGEVSRLLLEKEALQRIVATHPRGTGVPSETITAVLESLSKGCDVLEAKLEATPSDQKEVYSSDALRKLKTAMIDIANRRSPGAVPGAATSKDAEAINQHLTFEIDRVSHLRAFIPTFAHLSATVEDLVASGSS